MRRALACAVVASVAAAFGPFAKKPTPPPRGADPEKQFDGATLSSRDKVSAYNRPPEDSALLSERWKEDEADAAGGPGLGAALKGAALAVALAAFSQVPLGKQDVSIPANDPSRVPVTNFVKVLD
mmetsp:Transcript_3674/g.9009  ORF Transcript_3674/g.9009 Transcript_3674/m.9009 type:complete len:125 (+) Transcript_3674:460-834(+)